MRYLKVILIVLVCIKLNAQNTWLQKANFGGVGRDGHSSFVINDKIYFVGGWDFTTNYTELWMFDPSNNTWTQKASMPGAGRRVGVAFAIGTKAYYGTGDNGSPFSTYLNDFYEYDSTTDTWTQKANFPGLGRYGAIAFVQNGYGYIGLGSAQFTTYLQDIWMYNPTTDSWTQKANFGGTPRRYATTFNIGTKTYVGTGQGATGHGNTFYEYNYVIDTWTQKAGYPAGVSTAVGFDINGKGYVLTGYNGGTYQQTMYEYNAIGDYWTQKANFGGGIRGNAIAASVNGLGYVCGGYGGGMHNDMWEYTQSTPAAPTASFSIPSTNICIGSCINITNQSTNSPDYFNWDLAGSGTPSTAVASPTGICYNTLGTYSITLIVSNGLGADTLVKTINVVNVPSLTITASSTTICAGKTVTLTGSGANSYTWTPSGLTNPTVVVTPTTSTNYTLTGKNTFNCSSTKTVSITVNPKPVISVNSSSICAGKSFTINPSGAGIGGTYTITGGSAVVSPTANTNYSVTGTSAAGCVSSNTAVSQVTVVASPTVAASSSNTLICSGETVTLTATGASTYTWNPGGAGSNIVVSPSITTDYTVTGTTGSCSNKAVSSVSVDPTPTVNVSSSNAIICISETATLTASGADTYSWLPSDSGPSIAVSPTVTTDYTVTGTTGNCSGTTVFTQSVSLCTSISALAKEETEITIYPNPFQDKFVIVSSNSSHTKVEVFNNLGLLVSLSMIENRGAEIDLSQYDSGIYFIRIGTATRKLIKK